MKSKKRQIAGDIARVVIVVGLFAAVALIFEHPAVQEQIDVQHLRSLMRDTGWRGALIFFAATALITAVGIPRLWISVAAGALYGAVEGSVVAQAASLGGAILNFYLARTLLRGPITRRLTPRMKHWYKRLNENGFRWILYLRLFPLSNASLTNTIGGISRMRTRDFVSATFLGYLPMTIIFALFGSSAAKRSLPQLVVAGIIFSVVLVGRYWYEKLRKEPEGKNDGESKKLVL
ncbi:hypothetical protein CVU37_08555 [candidate division BRC1 bacterium HGW-BRC1-1]|jgi:uncharacterized membrane protein YdjX (TVP38/TMEM64 family)|nr:MAG: hypothetical protein CVU37_08555 [candidate division BRC1 bacterium HGW-BRC1-1]